MSPKEKPRSPGFIRYNPEEKYSLVEKARRRGLVQNLNPKWQQVINARFSPPGETPSFTEVGKGLANPVSRQRAHEIHEMALGRLKRWLDRN